MNEVKKRGWVKNAAIIFLAVMLVLTFFSNTIMNRSLPEVAAQYTQSGSITARIRGTGTVTANETVEVEVSQAFKVETRLFDVGDEVTLGQVLIRLSGDVSKELESAQDALNLAELAYERVLINSPLVGGNVAIALQGVTAARNALADAQRVLASVTYSDAAYNAAVAARDQAQAKLDSANAAAVAARRTANNTMTELELAELELKNLGLPPDEGGTVDPDIYYEALQKVAAAEAANDLAQIEARAAERNASLVAESTSPAFAEYNRQETNRQSWLNASAGVRSAQQQLDAANNALNTAQTSDEVAGLLNSVEIREAKREVDEKREALEVLQKEGSVTEITSPVNGKVISRAQNLNPGQFTDPAQPLLTLEVTDRGYSLNINASAQQASRVNIGDHAEVDRGWWGGNLEPINAVLIGIRNDPQNPATGRILHFNVSGGVNSGDTLNIVLSQRTENYNIIVPNGAVREDTNGQFLLIVESRSSPLGNRFIAQRADINVIASDDTNSAVTGALSGWDFIITRSSAPINPGDQVRLADN